ncbi:hypothetical protein KRZ98_17395 [Sphingobium sp. AS12]|uniref:hypothetical protein n=1 Tax=Sphingobium sp. AS12 TaxID=2849495 RepID=UPI001C31505C|nr:hypothetical protein [Sphingobium sp. AS12]MBV2150021.1 hypothetical protein [Sphingobium sp. AS12]
MSKSPDNGRSIEDNEESDEFLCAIAAESVNDAILLLGELRSGLSAARPHLQAALALLTSEGHITPDSDGKSRSTLSSMAIDLMVEKRFLEIEARIQGLDSKHRPVAPKAQCAASAKARQRALMYMIEALSILDSINDDDAIAHLQLAIDRTIGNPPTALSAEFLSELAKQLRH